MKPYLFLMGLILLLATVPVGAAQQRFFQFIYTTTVTDIPINAQKVQLWLPYPTSDSYQIIHEMAIDSPYPMRITREFEYDNHILYVEANAPLKASFTVQMQFKMLRKEWNGNSSNSQKLSQPLSKRLLEADKLVPVDGKIAELSAQITQGKNSDEAKIRAIYDYVTRTLNYDKSGSGWGYGDALHACDVKQGNCTDFHSLIIGMARAAGIPAVFEIGFPIPKSKTSGKIGGYHCWAKVFVDGKKWLPMDSSEASKHPKFFDYYFGNLCENRLMFTKGRDLTLNPPQSGPPLNYFIYPYVEIDGKIHNGIVKAFQFKDLGSDLEK